MLEKTYDHNPVEGRWSRAWRESKLFAAKAAKGKDRPFVMVIPPPNVTGALHIGHALNNTLQDILLRWHKLHGREVCWVPGTDHGGIATQNVMERQLKAEGKTRHDLGREKFVEVMQAWSADCKKTILGQLERLGCGLDWDREAFTMDEARAKAVHQAFSSYWDKGLIYRGERMVNWCVRCGTALSDIEVEYEERKGHLWHLHYPLKDGGEGLTVATTRPETMLGDTAVAVHPGDERYKALHGKALLLPLMNRAIPVVADEAVESSFGTGAVKVTPAHDPNDFEIAGRHALPLVKVIGPDGKMTPEAGPYAGLSREKARDKVLADLEAGGFLRKTEDHKHSVGVCYRCMSPVEPLVSKQWFVRMKELAAPAIKAAQDGRFKIHPESWTKPYVQWLTDIRDWCISRQIWWGHRIPVWYCAACRDKEGYKPVVSADKPASCPACAGHDLEQDPDVLDTWFSSALWPLSTLGWPKETEDLAHFYPTSVLVTGYEILYLWVARMQMSGLEARGTPPFDHAYIHGIVRDKRGKKMSKSLGNVVDPLVMMDKYGTDALRFSLAVQAHPGKDIPFAEDSITGSRNFANKIWNSTRFVLMNLPEKAPEGGFPIAPLKPESLELCDRWILAEYRRTLVLARARMAEYEVAAAADALYGFLWDKFCDWYVELAKIRLQGADEAAKAAPRAILVHVLTGTLKMLHPFMPFVTEELYATLKPFVGESADFLLRSGAPDLGSEWESPGAVREMERLIDVVKSLRTLRSEMSVPPGLRLGVFAAGGESRDRDLLFKYGDYVRFLGRLSELKPSQDGERPPHSATAVAAGMTFFVPLEGVIDLSKERQRLDKEIGRLEGEVVRLAARLGDEAFMGRAPREQIDATRSQHGESLAKLERLKEVAKSL